MKTEGPGPLQTDSSALHQALYCADCSAVVRHLWQFSSARETSVEGESALLELDYTDRNPHPGPCLVYPHANEGSESWKSDPKDTVRTEPLSLVRAAQL